jgi:hypothetical protein
MSLLATSRPSEARGQGGGGQRAVWAAGSALAASLAQLAQLARSSPGPATTGYSSALLRPEGQGVWV